MLPPLELLTLTEHVLHTTLGNQQGLRFCESDFPDAASLSGSIEIAGAWPQTIHFEAERPFPTRAASRRLMIPESDVSPADEAAVIAELTTRIGDIIKSLSAAPSQLGLPDVQPIAHAVQDPRDTSVRTVAITRWDDTMLRVAVCRRGNRGCRTCS